MALDVFRAVLKTEGQAVAHFANRVTGIVNAAAVQDNSCHDSMVQEACDRISGGLSQLISCKFDFQHGDQVMLRDFMFSLANLYVGALLIEHAKFYSHSRSDAQVAHQWATKRDLVPIVSHKQSYVKDVPAMQELIFEGYDDANTVETRF